MRSGPDIIWVMIAVLIVGILVTGIVFGGFM